MITVRQLPAGTYHLQGEGLKDWAYLPSWPCSDRALLEHVSIEASPQFIQLALEAADAERRYCQNHRQFEYDCIDCQDTLSARRATLT